MGTWIWKRHKPISNSLYYKDWVLLNHLFWTAMIQYETERVGKIAGHQLYRRRPGLLLFPRLSLRRADPRQMSGYCRTTRKVSLCADLSMVNNRSSFRKLVNRLNIARVNKIATEHFARESFASYFQTFKWKDLLDMFILFPIPSL